MICSVCNGTARVPGTVFECVVCEGGEIPELAPAPAPPVEAADAHRPLTAVDDLGAETEGDGYGEHPLAGAW